VLGHLSVAIDSPARPGRLDRPTTERIPLTFESVRQLLRKEHQELNIANAPIEGSA
jgi:hypothetical protein